MISRRIARNALLLLGLLGLGCSNNKQQLSIHRDYSTESYFTTFERAYFGVASDGQTDLVLVSGNTDTSQPPVVGPLTSHNSGTLQQMVHIHILWQQPRSLRDSNPAASNAKITWHVVTSPNDRVIYNGSCWARVSIDGQTASFDLRNASVSISRVVGNATDPLKRASLDGVVEASRADSLVRSYIDDLSAIEAAESAKSNGAPERKQVNP